MAGSVLDLFNLQGRTALITGASGYLGSALAEALAEAGASVIASSRELSRAKQVCERLPTIGQANHQAIALDYASEAATRDGFQRGLELAGHIDILVNNGHSGPGQAWDEATRDGFEQHFANLTGYFELARLVRDHAVARSGTASIVLMGSMYGLVGSYPDAYAGVCSASPAAYHALKGGVVQLTRHLAVYWAGDGVRVNCLSPGPFPNPQSAPPEMVARLETKSPMKRMGKPDELKGALLLLCSEAGSYLNGHNLVVDGGWTAW